MDSIGFDGNYLLIYFDFSLNSSPRLFGVILLFRSCSRGSVLLFFKGVAILICCGVSWVGFGYSLFSNLL